MRNSKNLNNVPDHYYNLVPIEMCIYSLKYNVENLLSLYLLLKLRNPDGKTKLSVNEINTLAKIMMVTTRTIKNRVKRLLKMKWVRYNNWTKFYLLVGYDKIRKLNDWNVRSSIEFYYNHLPKLKAILGAVIYGYLNRNYWRKVKRERSVLLRGDTYHSLSPPFFKKSGPTPISVLAVQKIFNISKSKASRLKIEAATMGLIKITKNYKRINIPDHDVRLIRKYELDQSHKIVFINGSYCVQGPDLIQHKIGFRKRKKLGTYIRGYNSKNKEK